MSNTLSQLDNSGNVKGKAIEEIEEETGLQIEPHHLEELASSHSPLIGSISFGPGLTDEHISLYLLKQDVSAEMIKQLQGQECGLRDRGELITLRLVPLKDAWKSTRDAKTLVSLFLYEQGLKNQQQEAQKQ